MADRAVSLQTEAEAHWDNTDPVMANLSRSHPLQESEYGFDDPFVSLVESLVYQQISVKAGASVFRRLEDELGTITPKRVVAAGEERLKTVGLSGSKVRYIQALATHCLDGLNLDELQGSDQEVIDQLTVVPGIGPWTAKMFMMFHMGRMDISAPEDLALRYAFADVYGGTEKEAAKGMQKMAGAWSPYNTVAARVLWKSRNGED